MILNYTLVFLLIVLSLLCMGVDEGAGFVGAVVYEIGQFQSQNGQNGGGRSGFVKGSRRGNSLERDPNGGRTTHISSNVFEKGWCEKEVETASLFRSGKVIPPGNGSLPHLSVVKDCCEGYGRRNINGRDICEPYCHPPCAKSFCTAPNVCGDCFPDHVRSLAGDCVATCPISCLNGNCSYDGKCTCLPGFKWNTEKTFCAAVCEKDCGPTRNCTYPNVCSCNKGYAPNQNEDCMPICTKDCFHGVCAAPESCYCNPGYFIKDSICQASCWQECINGKCVDTDICVCDYGYELIDNVCQPICSSCTNGTCIGAEICLCDKGFFRIEDECVYFCTEGCNNGFCVAPETCVCKRGYHKNPNTGRCSANH